MSNVKCAEIQKMHKRKKNRIQSAIRANANILIKMKNTDAFALVQIARARAHTSNIQWIVSNL